MGKNMVKRLTLKNGTRVVLEKMPMLDTVSIGFIFLTGSANEKNRLPSCTESARARQDYASGIGIMCQGPLPAFPRGLGARGLGLLALSGRVRERTLRIVQTMRRVWTTRGPTQGIGASLVPSPWHNAGHRENFRVAAHR